MYHLFKSLYAFTRWSIKIMKAPCVRCFLEFILLLSVCCWTPLPVFLNLPPFLWSFVSVLLKYSFLLLPILLHSLSKCFEPKFQQLCWKSAVDLMNSSSTLHPFLDLSNLDYDVLVLTDYATAFNMWFIQTYLLVAQNH